MDIKSLMFCCRNIVLSLFVVFTTNAQENKYGLERIVNDKISNSGQRISFFSIHNSQQNLHIKDKVHNREYVLKNVSTQSVLNDTYAFGFNFNKKELYCIDFIKQKIDTIPQVEQIVKLENDKMLLDKTTENHIIIVNLNERKFDTLKDVNKFFINESNVVLINEKNIKILNIKDNRITTIGNTFPQQQQIKRVLTTNKNSFYFLNQENKKLYIYNLNKNKINLIHSLPIVYNESKILDTLYTDATLVNNNYIALKFKHEIPSKNSSEVEIWNGNEMGIQDVKRKKNFISDVLFIDVSNKRGGITNLIENMKIILAHNTGLVFGYNYDENSDFERQFPVIDLFELDVFGDNKHYIGNFGGAIYNWYQSYLFPHIFYYKNGNWHFFHPLTKKHVTITHTADDYFYNKEQEYPSFKDDGAYNNFVVLNEDNVLFHGYYDVWNFNLKTEELSKVTNGRINKKRVEIAGCNYRNIPMKWSWNDERKILPYKNIIFKWVSEDFTEEGIYLYENNNILNLPMDNSFKISQIKRSENVITYVKEKSNMPPTMMLYDLINKREVMLYTSNIWDGEVNNVKTKYIKWKNNNNEWRGAVIRYPKNYLSTNKYPAIFNIYEKKIKNQHHYHSPYEIIGGDINVRSYTDDGYFIIEPDIYYSIGKPGESVVNDINSTMDMVLEQFPIDPEKIGVFGHSFGGYQTNYLITKNNKFKAAVSSAGVSDLKSFYFTINWDTMKPDMWRMISQQWRIGKPFYQGKDLYNLNSPIYFADQITTPLLLVSGKEDYQINWNQSVMMYLALKSLNKKVALLLYPNEGHVLMNKQNQIDSHIKIKSWFDYYLKNTSKPNWF